MAIYTNLEDGKYINKGKSTVKLSFNLHKNVASYFELMYIHQPCRNKRMKINKASNFCPEGYCKYDIIIGFT
jgi:hypothetical protein